MKIALEDLDYLHPLLRQLLAWLEEELGFELVNTSNYRPGDSGVHGTIPVRGWDVRMRNVRVANVIASVVNENWTYDPTRPNRYCAVAHGEGANFHLHLQVHPNTERTL